MMLVELRRQVVHQIDALTSLGLIEKPSLRYAQGSDYQLLLTARKDLNRVMPGDTNTQVSSLRARLRMPQ